MTVRNTRPDVFTDEDRAALRAWCAGLSVQPVDEPFPLPPLAPVPQRPVTPLSERVVRFCEGVLAWLGFGLALGIAVLFTISESAWWAIKAVGR